MKKHTADGDVYILAIESSCDETAAAVVKNECYIVTDCPSYTLWRGSTGDCFQKAY